MKKKFSILLLLFCLLLSTLGVRPVFADEEGDNETSEIIETGSFLEEDDQGLTTEEEEEDNSDIASSIFFEEDHEDDEEESGFIIPSKDDQDISNDSFLFVIPEGFKIKPSDAEGKKALLEEGALETLKELNEGDDYKEDELYFFSDSLEYAEQVAEIYGCELTSYSDRVAIITLKDDAVSVTDVFDAAVNDPNLPLVEPNYRVYNRPLEVNEKYASSQSNIVLPEVYGWYEWVNEVFDDPDPYLISPSARDFQWQHEMVNTFSGWNATMGDSNIGVAVIDNSINPYHEEFVGRVEVEDIGHGTVYGYGHGNHVAGILAAEVNNGAGGAGIAPFIELISINVYDEGSDWAYYSEFVKAINRAIECEADIINMSNGGYTYDWELENAVNRAYKAGIVVVAAAGNDGGNVKNYPAAFDHAIAVANVKSDGTREAYSNFGPWITISAPGTYIYSACTSDDDMGDDVYDWMTGTSMATPVVSGALALYMSKFGHLNYDEAVALLKNSANKCSSAQMGFGIISIEKMFNASMSAPEIRVFDEYDEEIINFVKNVPEGSYLTIEGINGSEDDIIIYTSNGKKPAVKNGEIVTGDVYDGSISLDSFEKGTTITFNAAVVNYAGVMGPVKKFVVKAPAVKVVPNKIKTVSLNLTKTTLNYSNEVDYGIQLGVEQLIDINGSSFDLDEVDHIWLTSNKAVVEVDEDGYVTATGKGSAKITLKILDGSNKTAACNVTVNQLVETLEITGQDAIVPGGNATYAANILPKTANNKKIVWGIETDNPNITIAANGKVTVSKDVPIGEVFYIYASTTDSSEIIATKTVEVCQKATSILIDADFDDPRVVYTKGKLNNIRLFTVDLKDELNPEVDNEIQLYGYVFGNDISPVWTSSNLKVATVDEYGLVTAVGAGNAVITCMTNDGSKLKAKVNIKVTVPISSIRTDFSKSNCLALGKRMNLNNKVAFGALYGKPTLKKVNWTIAEVGYTINDTYYDITEDVAKDIKIAGNNLQVANKILDGRIDPSYGDLKVVLLATSADGTGYSDFQVITITSPISYLYFEYSNYYGYVSEGYQYIWFYCDQPVEFEYTSSNQKLCSVWDDGSDGNWHSVGMLPTGKGTVTITVKALDGSNKTAKTKIRFY